MMQQRSLHFASVVQAEYSFGKIDRIFEFVLEFLVQRQWMEIEMSLLNCTVKVRLGIDLNIEPEEIHQSREFFLLSFVSNIEFSHKTRYYHFKDGNLTMKPKAFEPFFDLRIGDIFAGKETLRMGCGNANLLDIFKTFAAMKFSRTFVLNLQQVNWRFVGQESLEQRMDQLFPSLCLQKTILNDYRQTTFYFCKGKTSSETTASVIINGKSFRINIPLKGIKFLLVLVQANLTIGQVKVQIEAFLDSQKRVLIARQHFLPAFPQTKSKQIISICKEDLSRLQVIGQAEKKFIICSDCKSRIILALDQHACHERVNLEQLIQQALECKMSIALNKPLRLSPSHDLSEEEMLFLSKCQFQFQIKERETMVVGIPAVFNSTMPNDEVYLEKIAHLIESFSISSQINSLPVFMHEMLKTVACKTSVRFGDCLSKSFCESLVQKLSKCDSPFECAHGRPSVSILAKLE